MASPWNSEGKKSCTLGDLNRQHLVSWSLGNNGWPKIWLEFLNQFCELQIFNYPFDWCFLIICVKLFIIFSYKLLYLFCLCSYSLFISKNFSLFCPRSISPELIYSSNLKNHLYLFLKKKIVVKKQIKLTILTHFFSVNYVYCCTTDI